MISLVHLVNHVNTVDRMVCQRADDPTAYIEETLFLKGQFDPSLMTVTLAEGIACFSYVRHSGSLPDHIDISPCFIFLAKLDAGFGIVQKNLAISHPAPWNSLVKILGIHSRILELHGEKMLNRTFNPGFRIRLHQKDLNLALQSARSMGLSLPNTATAQELFNAVAAQGGIDLDHSAMLLALEKLANHEVKG